LSRKLLSTILIRSEHLRRKVKGAPGSASYKVPTEKRALGRRVPIADSGICPEEGFKGALKCSKDKKNNGGGGEVEMKRAIP